MAYWGSMVKTKEEIYMFCIKCGNQVFDGQKFCPQCGAEIFYGGQSETEKQAETEKQEFGNVQMEVNNQNEYYNAGTQQYNYVNDTQQYNHANNIQQYNHTNSTQQYNRALHSPATMKIVYLIGCFLFFLSAFLPYIYIEIFGVKSSGKLADNMEDLGGMVIAVVIFAAAFAFFDNYKFAFRMSILAILCVLMVNQTLNENMEGDELAALARYDIGFYLHIIATGVMFFSSLKWKKIEKNMVSQDNIGS